MKRFRLRLSSVLWLVAIAGTMLWYSHIRASQNEPDEMIAKGRWCSSISRNRPD
jgi:hypothetical protein